MGHAAPIARFALAYSAGVAAGLLGAPLWAAPLLLLLALRVPNEASARPALWVTAGLAGLLMATAAGHGSEACVAPVVGTRVALEGRFLASPRAGSAPFVRADGCGEVTVVLGSDASLDTGVDRAGSALVVRGVWREGRRRPWLQGESTQAPEQGGGEPLWNRVRWGLVGWRDGLLDRIDRLYGEHAPLVAALTLARREGLDPALRENFAVTGVAHLLAISGFHVGVVAGLALAMLRACRVPRREAMLGAAALAGAYVGVIGFPDAACRAALILGFVALARSRGRPPSRWGALACAALVLLALDPTRLASPGFQLSFAGAAGLVAWSRGIGRRLEEIARRRVGHPLPRGVTTAIAAGVAATVATLPIAAWHFERVSLVGIPITLLASPLVSLALPGAIASVVADFFSPTLAGFFAGGVTVLLEALLQLTSAASALPGASRWISRVTVLAALGGIFMASAVARRPRIGGDARRLLVGMYVCTAVLAWPLLARLELRGTLELWMMDVGQGDAMAVRTPRGRWLLVDAGPPTEGDGRAHPVVRGLRDRGVDRLEVLILTHADADHYGGGRPVLEHLRVGRVLDPALPVAKSGYLEVVTEAQRLGLPWAAARAGQAFTLDGVEFRFLHPTGAAVVAEQEAPGGLAEANATSVVVLVSWGDFRALLTGDAYVDVERAIAAAAGDIDVLKVGHHGSRTSTDSLFLAFTRPEVALVSVGRRNRYGHPDPGVLRRLLAAGAEIHRTDREGGVRVIVGRSGTVTVRSER